MLNALSRTEKNDSDDQSRNAPPTGPSAAAFDWIARTARRIESSDVLGNVFVELADEERVLVRLVDEAEQREREEEQRHEREEREVRDHRRQMRPPVGEELPTTAPTVRQYARRRGRSSGHRRSDRDLAAGPRVAIARGRLARRANVDDAAAPSGLPTARARLIERGRGARGRGVSQLEAATVSRQRLRRPRRRPADRRDDLARADRRPRVLRPQDLPPLIERRRSRAAAPRKKKVDDAAA